MKIQAFLITIVLFCCLNVTLSASAVIDDVSAQVIVENCSDGIDNDDDGLVDCLDSDCTGVMECCGDVDTDNDGIGDDCDMDDDNDGIPDDKECPADTLMINANIHSWESINGADNEDILIGDVYVVRNHYLDDDGQMFDLRFELLGKFSQGVAATDQYTVEFSSSQGVQIKGAVPSRSDYITYSLNWVMSGTTTSANPTGAEGLPFEFAEITVFDMDNSSSANQVGYTDVGFFLDDQMDIRNFKAGSEVEAKELLGGQVAFGLVDIDTERAVSVANPCSGCGITASIPNFTGASLLHGVFGTTDRELTRQAQWMFRVARCPDYDGDGLDNLVDFDSDQDGCEDAIEGSASFARKDLAPNRGLSGAVSSTTGIPVIAGDCQFIGTSQNENLQDSLCNVPEICDNGIDDDGDGDTDCADADVANSCCCIDDLDPIAQGNSVVCPGETMGLTFDTGYESLTVSGISVTNNDVQYVNQFSITISEPGLYVINAVDSCQSGPLTDTFAYQFFELITPQTIQDTICSGQSIMINGVTYDTGGTFTQDAVDANGCEVTQSIVITEQSTEVRDTLITICQGESIVIEGTELSTEGTTLIESSGEARCGNSLSVTIAFHELGTLETIFDTLCTGQIIIVSGETFSAGGTFTVAGQDDNGCTVDQTVVITELSTEIRDTLITICEGESVVVEGFPLSIAGTTLVESSGGGARCGNSLAVTIAFHELGTLETILDTICAGQSVTVNGETLSSGGTFTVAGQDANGCAVGQEVIITELATEIIDTLISICEGESVTIEGVVLSTEGSTIVEIDDDGASRCGSSYNVTIDYLTSETPTPVLDSICIGESTIINGITYNEGGTFTDQITDPTTGCSVDRSIQIVAIDCDTCDFPSIDTTLNLRCFGDIMAFGQSYDTPGTYTNVLPGPGDCDTTVTVVVLDDCDVIACCKRMGNNTYKMTKRSDNTTWVQIRDKYSSDKVYFEGVVSNDEIHLTFEAFSLIENNYEQSDSIKRNIAEVTMKGQKIDKNSDLLTNFDTHDLSLIHI